MDYMVLEIFVLSVLRAGPVHGYELKRRVQRPSLTPLSNNSLYPMLRRFEADGIVTKTTEEQDGKPARNVYSITDAGRQRLDSLLRSLPPELAASDEEFLVRVSFFHEIPAADQVAILSARQAALDAVHAKVATLLAESGGAGKPVWRSVVMEHVLAGNERDRAWLAELAAAAKLTETAAETVADVKEADE
jgi:DNA-binding PadR family transcriptional regulator